MKILITGATGFIGQNLIPLLVKQCPNVHILTLDRNVSKAEQLFPSNLYSNVIHTEANNWTAILQFNPEIVFHLAAFSTSSNCSEVIESLISSNITYGVQLLKALEECPSLKLFINTGSFAEYRLGTGKYNSAYLYTATKTAFRVFLDYYSTLCNFKYITAVPYTVYGGKPTIKRLMDYIIESLDSPKPIKMTAGEQILDFIHVNDVVSFYIHIVQHIELYLKLNNGENFYLGTGHGYTIREIASLIEKETGKSCNISWGALPYRKRDTMHAIAPIAQNIELTGWHTQITIVEGIKAYIKNMLS